jgi:hypothetical protein
LQGIASYASADGNGKIIHAPVKPIRLLKHGNLTVKIRRSYDNNWKAIMELLEGKVKEEVRNRHVDGEVSCICYRKVDCRRKREAIVV